MPFNHPPRLWPVEYWQNKKKQFMAGSISGRRIWLASGLGGIAVLFAVTVAAGILTARPYEQARHIPLRPLPEDQLLPQQLTAEKEPSTTANKAVVKNPKQMDKLVAASGPEVWPATGEIVHGFGWQQHPVFQDWRYHTGIDLACAQGQPVTAAISGEVAEVRQDPKTGLTVIIGNGPWLVHHGSLAAAIVRRGEKVLAGQQIGGAGTSFQEPYPHLHLAIEKDGKYLNPQDVLPGQ